MSLLKMTRVFYRTHRAATIAVGPLSHSKTLATGALRHRIIVNSAFHPSRLPGTGRRAWQQFHFPFNSDHLERRHDAINGGSCQLWCLSGYHRLSCMRPGRPYKVPITPSGHTFRRFTRRSFGEILHMPGLVGRRDGGPAGCLTRRPC